MINDYTGADNGSIINDSGAPHSTGGGKMYVSINPLIATPTPTATATVTLTPTTTATATLTPTPTSPPTCQGITCNGWNPIDKGCANDAQTALTKKYVQDSTYQAFGVVENRFSNNCSSQWTRVHSYTVDVIFAEVSIRWGDGQYDFYPEDGAIDSQNPNQDSIYTDMVGNLGEVRNCGSVSTISITWQPQPIDPVSVYGQNNCFLTHHMPIIPTPAP